MTYLTERNGGRIVEMPIEFRDRTLGRSKMSGRIVVEAFVLVTWWGVRDRSPSADTAVPARARLTAWRSPSSPSPVRSSSRAEGLLLVQNRRRSGAIDWSTPGGVIDATDASLLAGLTREVEEETGLRRHRVGGPALRGAGRRRRAWAGRCAARCTARSRSRATSRVDDPDGIVVEAAFAVRRCVPSSSASCAPWVREPLADWLEQRWGPPGAPRVRLRRARHDAATTLRVGAHLTRTRRAVSGARQHPARRPRRVLRVGRAARAIRRSRGRPVIVGGLGARVGRGRGQLRGAALRRVLGDADGAGAPRLPGRRVPRAPLRPLPRRRAAR